MKIESRLELSPHDHSPFAILFSSFSKWSSKRCIRDTEDERIHVERRAVVKKFYFVFERRLFETTRVSTTDVCTCLKTFN